MRSCIIAERADKKLSRVCLGFVRLFCPLVVQRKEFHVFHNANLVNKMNSGDPFFSSPPTRAIFERATIQLRTIIGNISKAEEEKYIYILKFVTATFFQIQLNPELFDEHCLLNINSVGERLVNFANNISAGDVSHSEATFAIAYRFVIEVQLGSARALPEDLEALLNRVHDFDYDEQTLSQMKYAEHQMIINKLRQYIHHPVMVDLKELPAIISKSERERVQIHQDMEAREGRVNALKDNLNRYTTAFNFVGLYDGFKNLRAMKGTEGKVGLLGLAVLGVLMICPFLVKFYLAFNPSDVAQLDTAFYLSLVGFEIVLAYFFRVALHNYRSIKAQLIQIDLRMTLCQFIQDYATYAKEVQKESPQLLERFDQLVFSGIVSSEGALPSTFDGLDQIANIIEKLKSK